MTTPDDPKADIEVLRRSPQAADETREGALAAEEARQCKHHPARKARSEHVHTEVSQAPLRLRCFERWEQVGGHQLHALRPRSGGVGGCDRSIDRDAQRADLFDNVGRQAPSASLDELPDRVSVYELGGTHACRSFGW
jgi:hypothetical protein